MPGAFSSRSIRVSDTPLAFERTSFASVEYFPRDKPRSGHATDFLFGFVISEKNFNTKVEGE